MSNKKDYEEEEFVIEESSNEVDEMDIEGVEEQEGKKIKKLKEDLKACKREKAEHLEALQETKADFLNSKRRLQEQLERDTERATNTFIERLLPLCDSFDQALGDESAWKEGGSAWKSGLEAIRAQLNTILNTYEVERFGAVGDPFDPNTYEAVGVSDDAEGKTDTVAEVLQSGYMRKGELIRPAKVIINS